ncbi:MAG: hypothetical protein KAX53_06240 [Saprospiraceae bacterium]|jgi:hypothetical protein|nr:hypothetical protein [Saprospiraceae bacterium]MBP6447545.1 hypothetical protein [Saprospiraceae bacterium]MBP8213325.1 hypothetical protein [Saprospiraceae bacterium]
MTITYQFDNIDQIDQKFIQSLKAAFKGKSVQLNVEAIEVLPPKIEAAILRVENGAELLEVDLTKYEALVKDL